MLVDIFRHANDDGKLLQQLFMAIGASTLIKDLIPRRRILLGIFADAFVSIEDVKKTKQLSQSQTMDPAYKKWLLFTSYTILLCYECIVVAYDISTFYQSTSDPVNNLICLFIRFLYRTTSIIYIFTSDISIKFRIELLPSSQSP